MKSIAHNREPMIGDVAAEIYKGKRIILIDPIRSLLELLKYKVQPYSISLLVQTIENQENSQREQRNPKHYLC